MRACGSDPTLMCNLGVLLDDMHRKNEEAYDAALRGNPPVADCHYNLGGQEGQRKRQMAQYRRVIGSKSE